MYVDIPRFDAYFILISNIKLQIEIKKKVEDVLKKTPLEITPRRELPRFGKCKNIKTAPLIDLSINYQPNIEPETPKVMEEVAAQDDPILDFEVVDKPQIQAEQKIWEAKQNHSLELLTPSPLGFASFDSRSMDELMTPDEFGGDNLPPGLSNINYDIDLSDLSGENSMADEPKVEPKDPFSPDALKQVKPSFPTFDPFASTSQLQRDPFSPVLEGFHQFNQASSFAPQVRDPFSPIDPPKLGTPSQDVLSILDNSESPTSACLLPSPLQPQNTSDKVS